MNRLGIGIIGCGNISTTYLELAPLFAPIEIRGIADINLATAKKQGEEFDVAVFAVEDLLARGDIDIVVNLTVPSAHHAVTKSILAAGKHVYSEKPLGLSLEEVEDMRTAAEQTGLRIGAAPDTFLGGSHQMARHLIDAGEIGTVVSGTCHIMGHGMEDWHPNPEFFFKPGGGPMLDMGPYYLTNLIQLIGPARRVAALTSSGSATRTITSEPRAGETIVVETPTNIHALVEFVSGATVTLSTSWDVWAHRHGEMELYGTDGSLFLPDPNFFGGPVEIAKSDGSTAPAEAWDHPFQIPNPDRANYRCAGLADMAASIMDGRPHRCGVDVAAHVVDLMTAILRSGDSGDFVDLTTTCVRPAPLTPDEARALLA